MASELGAAVLLLVVLAVWLFRSLPELHGLVLDAVDLRKCHTTGYYARRQAETPPSPTPARGDLP